MRITKTKLLFALLIAILLFSCGCVNQNELQDKCTQECKKINMDFYKMSIVTTYAHTNYECFCLSKDKIPYNIGVIENQ